MVDDIDDIKLEMGDRVKWIAERIGKPGAYSVNNPRLRNLNIIWAAYANYIRDALRKSCGPGYPVWLVEDTFMLDRILIGPTTLDRAWFEERKRGGNHVFWVHPFKEEGFQWWITSWTWKQNNLTMYVTHWMIQRDENMKRSTIYFTRGFKFTENPDMGEYPQRLADSNTNLGKVPRTHREQVMDLARHATQHDDDEWILTMAPYSLFGTIGSLHNMIRILDVGDIQKYYIDKEFRAFWLRRVLDALWDGDWRPSRDQIDFDGLLKDTWLIPKTQHPSDAARFEQVYQEWAKFRSWYEKAQSLWLGIIRDKKPFDELVPQNEDT